jgi:acetyltransferase-like isoleucine patch superfamily enzyme
MKSARKRVARRVFHSGPPVPGFLRPVGRLFYRISLLAAETARLAYAWGIVGPTVRSIASVGPRLRIEQMPYIRGPGVLCLGADVYISGKIGISFSRHTDTPPELKIGDRTFVGHQCAFSAARSIAIGSECLISGGVRIQDNDGHPLDAARRRAGEPVSAEDIRPVVVKDGAWIGTRAIILKGVTIGENAIVGAGAVVTGHVPDGAIVAGNPARVVKNSHNAVEAMAGE